MNTVLWIILVFVALLGGFYGGAYFARKQMEKELAENPRLNVDAVRTIIRTRSIPRSKRFVNFKYTILQ